MSLTTPTKRVRGLGAAHDGVSHFWHQRLTAIALVPLGLWFAWLTTQSLSMSYVDVYNLFSQTTVAVPMILLISGALYHMKLGLQVVIEDYVHTEGTKLALLVINTFAAAVIGLVSVLAVLKIYLGA